MRDSFCPDCDSGWRYADEVPENQGKRQGLVPCPTCHGTGRPQTPDRPPISMTKGAA